MKTSKKDKASPLFELPEVVAPVDKTVEDEKPHFEATTLWDYPRQSYGKTPKGNNKF